jgi:hypothetical protein
MRRQRFLDNLTRYRTQFAVSEHNTVLWLTPYELTCIAGWSKQRTYKLLKTKLIDERTIELNGKRIRKLNSTQFASLLRT